MSAELHRLQYRPGILGVTVVQGGFLGGWPRVGPHIGKELEEQGGGSDLETGKRDGGDSHVCLPASPMEGLPPPSHRSLSLSPFALLGNRGSEMQGRGSGHPGHGGEEPGQESSEWKKLGPFGLAWVPVRPLRRGRGTRRRRGAPGLGRSLQSRDLTDEGQQAGVSTAEWACGFGSIPTLALPHPL